MSFDESMLTEEQKRGIDAFAKWYHKGRVEGFGKSPCWKMSGPAGSGKSTIARFAIENAGISSSEVVPMAPTGKASMVMRSKGVDDAGTIHSRIYIPQDGVNEAAKEARKELVTLRGSLGGRSSEEKEQINAKIATIEKFLKDLGAQKDDEVQWILNPASALTVAKLGMVDEASMVDGKIKRDLEKFDVPIIYIGDQFQLPPVDDSMESVFFDRAGRALPVDYELTQIHRQAEGSPIIRFSRDLRLNLPGQHFLGKQVGEDGGVLIRVSGDRITPELMAKAEQIICGRNATRHDINYVVRSTLGRQEMPYPVPGDKLICLKNSKDWGVVNGMTGVALTDYYDFDNRSQCFRVDIEMEDGRVIHAAPLLVPYFQFPGDDGVIKELPFWMKKKSLHFDYGFGITGHKAQGSQYGSGIIIEEPFGRTDEMVRRWLYTVYTRFSKSVIGAVAAR